jgi:hypothetical protein
MKELQDLVAYFVECSDTEKLPVKFTISEGRVKEVTHLSLDSALNIIEEIPVFMDLGVELLNEYTTQPRKRYLY